MNQYHTFWRRLGAALIDGIIFYPLTLIEVYIYNTTNIFLFYTSIFVLSFIPFFYFIILHAKHGQTLGKKAMNIKVIDINEVDFIGYKRATLRELPWIIFTTAALIYMFWQLLIVKNNNTIDVLEKYIDFTSFISFVWMILELITMLTNPRRRAIHDWMAKSVVVKIKN